MKKALCCIALILSCLILFSGCIRGSAPVPEIPDGPVPSDDGGEESVPENVPEPDAEPDTEPVTPVVPEPEEPVRDPAEDILASLSDEEKIAQLLYIRHPASGAQSAVQDLQPGGCIFFERDLRGKSPDDVRKMISSLQDVSRIPMFTGVDEEGGSVVRISSNPSLRSEPFPSPRKAFTSGGWDGIIADAQEKAALLTDLGFNMNFAPVCDVPYSSDDFIYARSFSTDPAEVSLFAACVVKVSQTRKMASVLKHFPGYGNAHDTHTGSAEDDRPLDTFKERDLLPFVSGIGAGAETVLVSHLVVSDIDPERPASLSPAVHKLLRDDLGFEGIILTDDLAMGAISEYEGLVPATVQAFLAGNDMILCSDYEKAYRELTTALEEGVIDIRQVDEAVLRILRCKNALGLLPGEE